MAVKQRKQRYDDDLFQESTMSFGDHLEELRRCLFKAILGLAVGFGVGLLVGNKVVEFIQSPLKTALENYYQDKAIGSIQSEHGRALDPESLAVVQREGKIFEQVFVEPNTILKGLANAYPNQFHDLHLPRFQITPDDLLKPAALAGAIRDGGKSESGSPGRRVWELLTTEEQKEMAALADFASVDGGTPSAVQRQAAATALDGVLDHPDLVRDKDFSEVKLTEDDRKRLDAGDTLTTDDLRRLNWTALASAFPETLRTPHLNLTEILLWRKIENDYRVQVKTFNAQEGFMIYIKASLISGVVFASPWIFYQIWGFVGAGLYPHERRYVHLFLPVSVLLFLMGAGLAFFFVFKPVLHFLFSFNGWLGLDPDPRISEWLGFVLWMPIGFGVSFQLPLVMLFVQRIGLVDTAFFYQKWRIAVLAIFILAATLSPSPDPYSMLLMAVPLTLLYFGGIWLTTMKLSFLGGPRRR